MIIISHRGYWQVEEEKNSIQAFKRSFDLNFGTETDIRDYQGDLVISHDIACNTSLSFTEFLKIHKSRNKNLPLALNIKADGLQNKLFSCLNEHSVKNYFVFDMSIPDTVKYKDLNMNYFIRQSEYETDLPFYKNAAGIWLDSFKDVWYTKNIIKAHLENGKKVVIVSAELHGRCQLSQWAVIKSWSLGEEENVMICTDKPEKAIKYFK